MRIKYPKVIQESEEDLTRLEERLRGQKAADRVRLLRRLEKWSREQLRDSREVNRPRYDRLRQGKF